MAIEIGSGLNGAAASVLTAGTRFVRKADFAKPSDGNTDKRLGFGEGTISSLGVAATTVDRNLKSAREIVPSFDELSAEARARSEAIRDQAANTEQARVERGSTESLRNENAARAQAEGFEPRTEETDSPVSRPFEQSEDQQPVFTTSARNVESVVSFVAPEPAASFDVFG